MSCLADRLAFHSSHHFGSSIFVFIFAFMRASQSEGEVAMRSRRRSRLLGRFRGHGGDDRLGFRKVAVVH